MLGVQLDTKVKASEDLELVRLSDALLDLRVAAAGFGARLGYGLAKTWPESIEALEDWIRRAWEMADLDVWLTNERARQSRWAMGGPDAA